MIEGEERLLPREEPFAGAELASAFDERGVTVHTGARVVAAERASDAIVLKLDDGSRLSGDRLLVGSAPASISQVDIGSGEIVDVVHGRRAPVIPAAVALGP